MWQKIWAEPPPPLIWTTSKRTAAFFVTPSQLRCCCLFSTRPQIYIKSESNIQIFPAETIVYLENVGKEANMHMPLWKQCKHSKHCKQYKQCQQFIGIYGIFFLSTDQMFSKSLNSRKNEHSYSGLITLHVSLITQSKSKWKSIRNQDYWPS